MRIDVPSGWEATKLGHIANLVMGQSPPSELCNNECRGLPFFQGNAEFGYRHPRANKWIVQEFKIAERGDVLVSVRAPVGELNVASERCVIGRGLAAIQGTKCEPSFSYFMMQERRPKLELLGQGSTFNAINSGDLRDIQVILPPLPEQRKIATILSSVDEAIQATQAVIEQTLRVKEGLLQELLTKGIGHTRFKQTPIGEIPEGWEVLALGAILEVQGGYAFSSQDSQETGARWLKIANVALGHVDWSTASFLPQRFVEKHHEFLLAEDDIVMAMTRPTLIGQLKIARIGSEGNGSLLNQRVCRLKPSGMTKSDFLFYIMQSDRVMVSIQKMIGGTDPPNLSGKQIESILVGVPPLEEQLEIGSIFESTDNSFSAGLSQLQSLNDLKSGLLQDLLTGKVRVLV